MCFTTILFLKIRSPLLSLCLLKGLLVGANVVIDCASVVWVLSLLLDDKREKVFPNKI